MLTFHSACAVRAMVACAGLLALAGGAGCQSGPSPSAEFVAQAEQLHRGSLASAVSSDKDLNDYFDEMGQRVVAGAAAADPAKARDPVLAHIRFHLVGSETVNAFDTGGGHIYVYNGLFQLCQNEDELASIMAHEFAHAVTLDLEKSGMKPLTGATLDRIAYQFVLYPFNGPTELAADELAFSFYLRGGWDPARFGDVFDRLRTKGLDFPSSTRPSLAARALAARGIAAHVPPESRNWRQPTVADAQTFRELRARANGSSERADPVNRAWLYLRAFPNCLLPTDMPDQHAAQAQLKKDTTPTQSSTPEPN
jgi:hypothetical protein